MKYEGGGVVDETGLALYQSPDGKEACTDLGQPVLTNVLYFHNIGNMETKDMIAALGALAQETRLAIFRLLVEAGPAGMPVGAIAEKLQLANATLSFHLKELTHAGLTVAQPQGRSIIYSARFETMNGLIAYLTENCCAGSSCSPSIAACAPDCAPKSSVTKRKK